MKNIVILALLFCTCVACSSDDENRDWLLGRWNLSLVSGGLLGTHQTYNAGEVVWQFNADNTIVVMSLANYTIAGMPIGTYNYHTIQNGNGVFLVVEGRERGEISVNNNTLHLNPNRLSDIFVADALTYDFVR